MNELNTVFKIPLSVGQHARKALAVFTHSSRALGWSIRRTSKSAEHVVLHAGPRKNMGTQHEHAAVSQRWRSLLDYLIGLHLVNRVRQGMGAQRTVLAYRFRQIWTVRGDAAGENKPADDGFVAIGFSDSLHHPGCTGHVDVPHAVKIEHAGAHRIEDKRQVNYRDRASLPQ